MLAYILSCMHYFISFYFTDGLTEEDIVKFTGKDLGISWESSVSKKRPISGKTNNKNTATYFFPSWGEL